MLVTKDWIEQLFEADYNLEELSLIYIQLCNILEGYKKHNLSAPSFLSQKIDIIAHEIQNRINRIIEKAV